MYRYTILRIAVLKGPNGRFLKKISSEISQLVYSSPRRGAITWKFGPAKTDGATCVEGGGFYAFIRVHLWGLCDSINRDYISRCGLKRSLFFMNNLCPVIILIQINIILVVMSYCPSNMIQFIERKGSERVEIMFHSLKLTH